MLEKEQVSEAGAIGGEKQIRIRIRIIIKRPLGR